jgi:outer membrane protein insertion porin family
LRNRLFLGVWLVLLWAVVSLASEPIITEVRVRGNLRIEAGRILQKMISRAGEPYDPKKVREDIRSIYAMGYFKNVVVELDEKGVLTFLVLERPALRDWRVEGAKEVEREDLEKALTMLKKREIIGEARIEEGAEAIRALYREKGYYLAAVRFEIVPIADGKNHVDVVYTVDEGAKVRVKDVHLMGVAQVDEEDLRSHLTTSEAGYWSWLTGSGKFKETDLERDREVVRSYYLNHGFVEVEVSDPLVSLTKDRKWLKIDLPITEGESFRIDTVQFSGDLEFPVGKLRETAALREGEVFRSDDVRKAEQKLTDLYADIGYAFVEVDPKTRLDKQARTVALDFQIHKGDLIHIGRVQIRGNTKTRDRVIRREILLSEGDLYNATSFRKSRQRIENLGFFEKVNLNTQRRPGQDLVDLDLEVEEKATGAFSVGAGYSSVDKIVGMGSVSQRNLFGLGYQLALSASLGSSRETYNLTFNNPRVFDTEVYAGFDVYKAIRRYSDFDKNSVGTALRFGFPLNEEWRIRWIYRLEQAKVSSVDQDASDYLKEQKGTSLTSSLSNVLTFDTRDNQWDPHSGAKADFSVEAAGGPFGGDTQFLKYEVDGSKYIGLWWGTVLTLHGGAGFIHALGGEEIPIYERFFLGGITTLRGFDSRGVGPKEATTGDVIGGDKDVLFNAEYLFPLVEEAKMKGVVFFDAGNAWDTAERFFASPLRMSAGLGIRWFSPMGPLRLEWGYVLDRKEDERPSRWEFSIGGFF